MKVADVLRKNAPEIENKSYQGKIIGKHPKYVEHKKLLGHLYADIEKKGREVKGCSGHDRTELEEAPFPTKPTNCRIRMLASQMAAVRGN